MTKNLQNVNVTAEDLDRFTEMKEECEALRIRLALLEECLQLNEELIARKLKIQKVLNRLDEKAA